MVRYRITLLLITLLVGGCSILQLSGLSEIEIDTSTAEDGERPVVYWRFFWLDSGIPEDDMIELFPQALLERVESELLAGDDPAQNIQLALQHIIDTPDNRLWETENLTINEVLVEGSAARISLSGDIMVFGGAVASGTRIQIVLTIFEEPGIETALITLNGENFANLHVDHESQRQAETFVYTREFYEAYVTSP